jgi:hypothetical protein
MASPICWGCSSRLVQRPCEEFQGVLALARAFGGMVRLNADWHMPISAAALLRDDSEGGEVVQIVSLHSCIL